MNRTHEENEKNCFKKYRRTELAELRPFEEGEVLDAGISVSETERAAGSPKVGDYIGRNPANHGDQWLIGAEYFLANFEPVDRSEIDDQRATVAALERELRVERERLSHLETGA